MTAGGDGEQVHGLTWYAMHINVKCHGTAGTSWNSHLRHQAVSCQLGRKFRWTRAPWPTERDDRPRDDRRDLQTSDDSISIDSSPDYAGLRRKGPRGHPLELHLFILYKPPRHHFSKKEKLYRSLERGGYPTPKHRKQ
mmetsp:Transcript_17405/g.38503  ORF Transcript_17405/g.38503 Transcript_17405/m.38503 type:complete len:138 (-) Transcript_17405:154-567(-)